MEEENEEKMAAKDLEAGKSPHQFESRNEGGGAGFFREGGSGRHGLGKELPRKEAGEQKISEICF
jgi:hypothetical protein